MLYPHFSAAFTIRGIDLHYVKTGLQIPVVTGQIQLGSGEDPPLLGMGDELPGFRKVSIFSQLNFNKDNEISFFRNNIDLSATAGIVPLQDAVAAKA